MQAFDDLGLPLVIGEFGLEHNGQNVDEATIMAQAQQRGNGYIGWSWSGNGGCCTFLDMVSNFGTALTTWGQIVVNGPERHLCDLGAGLGVRTGGQQPHGVADLVVVRLGRLVRARDRDGQRELDGYRQSELDHVPRPPAAPATAASR